MTHTRPTGIGWVTGQQGEPVTTLADPPGDGIGPDLTPPDRIPGQDPAEYQRLADAYAAATGAAPEEDEEPEVAEQHGELSEDPREVVFGSLTEDPREGDRSS